MDQANTLRYVVGADPRLEFLTSSGVWERVQGVKSVHPMADMSNVAEPTLGRVELSRLTVLSDAHVEAAR